MSRKRPAGSSKVRHAGRVTLGDCPVRGDEPCAPVNRVTTWTADGAVKDICTCSCGRRFPVTHPDAVEHLLEPLGPPPGEVEPGASETWTMADAWPDERQAPRAAIGVAPIGTPVLHEPAARVGRVTDDVRALAKHMVKVMHRAPGVGLAANQVGAGVRLFVQVHRRAAPETMIDPDLRASAGHWTFPEGCLSVEVDHTECDVVRPRRIQVRARTLHGDTVEVTADEILARICQHEMDHLDGIEYVQRLTGTDADRVYGVLTANGVDVAWVPHRPYGRG